TLFPVPGALGAGTASLSNIANRCKCRCRTKFRQAGQRGQEERNRAPRNIRQLEGTRRGLEVVRGQRRRQRLRVYALPVTPLHKSTNGSFRVASGGRARFDSCLAFERGCTTTSGSTGPRRHLFCCERQHPEQRERLRQASIYKDQEIRSFPRTD